MRTRFRLSVANLTMLLVGLLALQGDAVAQPLFQPWLAPQSGGPPPMTRTLPKARQGHPPGVTDRSSRAIPFREPRATVHDHGIAQHLQRQTVDYPTSEPAGTIIIDTANTYLYLVLGQGKALRYGIGVGREGFTWSGRERISRMAEWPNWRPPAEMLEREPHLPDFMPGGPNNPLGARALYLGHTLYRIHGTNEPSSIGTYASSGCIRLLNEDVMDLYQRVSVGTSVVVLPKDPATVSAR
jgi:lipoprotein-anchoring transpeptidase ErfK/SrfK